LDGARWLALPLLWMKEENLFAAVAVLGLRAIRG